MIHQFFMAAWYLRVPLGFLCLVVAALVIVAVTTPPDN